MPKTIRFTVDADEAKSLLVRYMRQGGLLDSFEAAHSMAALFGLDAGEVYQELVDMGGTMVGGGTKPISQGEYMRQMDECDGSPDEPSAMRGGE